MIKANHGIDITYIRNRINDLREKKGRTEYHMSLDLGHSRGYIQNILACRSKPSLDEFLAICDYFEITPEEFFNVKSENPVLENEILDRIRNLNDKSKKAVLGILDALKSNAVNTE
jgi:transcriptional regulator with XRE-family HTH domain